MNPETSSEPAVRARGLAKHYRRRGGDVRVLDGLDLDLAAGSFTAVRGRSGSGKSTLLLALGALLRADAGSIRIGGQEITGLSGGALDRFRARHVGFVFQRFHLLPYLDAAGNVAAGGLGAGAVDPARTRELLGRFGLADRAGHRPSQLSAGEQQRVALARALYAKPALLLADEPTGNLDPENAKIVLDAFAAFARDGGAVLMVTHEPSVAARAHRTLSLREGRLETSA